jgi:hypothetical protein
MEDHYKQQIEGWRRELDSKHQQFEEARAQIMQPRELEKLRRQLMEELETPTRERLQAGAYLHSSTFQLNLSPF